MQFRGMNISLPRSGFCWHRQGFTKRLSSFFRMTVPSAPSMSLSSSGGDYSSRHCHTRPSCGKSMTTGSMERTSTRFSKARAYARLRCVACYRRCALLRRRGPRCCMGLVCCCLTMRTQLMTFPLVRDLTAFPPRWQLARPNGRLATRSRSARRRTRSASTQIGNATVDQTRRDLEHLPFQRLTPFRY